MTTRLYLCIVGGVAAGIALCVLVLAGMKHFAHYVPRRPAGVAAAAVWRPTPAERLDLTTHGDWIACHEEGVADRCVVTDAEGTERYNGIFEASPERAKVPDSRLKPITSETISPWMWSNRAGRMVPVIHLEDGTVLVPSESADDLRGYVALVSKFSVGLKPVPVYLQYHPAGSK